MFTNFSVYFKQRSRIALIIEPN